MRLRPGNAKALYRRGLALQGCGELALARVDLLAAARQEPRNQELRRSLEEPGALSRGSRRGPRCLSRAAEQKKGTKEDYGGFLSR